MTSCDHLLLNLNDSMRKAVDDNDAPFIAKIYAASLGMDLGECSDPVLHEWEALLDVAVGIIDLY